MMMPSTPIYLELAGKKAIAWSLDWPGWCRIRASEEAVLEAMRETTPRCRMIVQRAGLRFAPGEFMIVERLLSC